jgi:hypothetical protein
MPYVRFEPTIQASERAKTVHALDSSAIVIGVNKHTCCKSQTLYITVCFDYKSNRLCRIWIENDISACKII